MPRTPKPKTPNPVGAPAAKYPNRTDLAAQNAAGPASKQPIRVPTGQEYGAAQASAVSQQLAPLPQQAPVPTAPPIGPSAPGAGTAMIPGTLTPQAAVGYTPPDLAISSTPSNNPNEPLTAGLPVGAGAGPRPQGRFGAGAMLAALAAATGDQNLAALADTADYQGF